MRKNEIPQNFTLSLFSFGLGIGFASFAHPCLGFLCKKQERCRVFLVLFSTRLVSELSAGHKTKQENFQFSCFLRRGRLSNLHIQEIS